MAVLIPPNGALAQSSRLTTIDEILVSARKREERLIDTPVAASVMSADDIDRYHTRNLSQLTARVPGLQITEGAGGGAGGNVTIRGIGKPPGTADYGMDQPVSIVMDGMSFSRGHMLKSGFFDVEAVEVLKGPQALYFGKNSPAGVVSIRSKTPEVGGQREMFVRALYEFETEDPAIELGLSAPVGENLAFRLAARGQKMQSGWLKNNSQPLDVSALYGEDFSTRGPSNSAFPSQEQSVVRLTSVWEPVVGFKATLKNFHSFTERNNAGTTVLFACADGPDSTPFFTVFPDPTQDCPDFKARNIANATLPPAEIANRHPFIDEDSRFFDKLRQMIHTLEMSWDISEDFSLTSMTGYWDYRHREYTNYDYTSYAVVISKQGESGEAFTQEFRLQSSFDGPVNFMVGAFYEDAERTLDAPVQILPSAFFPDGSVPYQAGQFPGDEFYDGSFLTYHQNWANDIESFSVFASVDWDLTDRLQFTGGVRYTDEKRSAFGGNLFENSGFLGFSPSGVMYSPKVNSDNFSPELTFSYHLRPDLMTYASFKSGFQSAGISNPGTVPNLAALTPQEQNDALTFDETTIQGFEIGLKGRFLDGRLRADLAAFAYEAEDLQVGIFNSNTTTFTIQNAAVAHNWGVEWQADYQVSERLDLRLAGQYNNLKYDEWEDAGCHSVDGSLPFDVLNARTPPGCHIGPAGAPIQDLSGERYGGAPWQVNAGLTVDIPVIRGWTVTGTLDGIYHSKGKRILNQPFTEDPSRTVVNLGARLARPDSPWEVALICQNCLDETYVIGIGNKPLAKINPGVSGDLTGQAQPPRLVTLQVTYDI